MLAEFFRSLCRSNNVNIADMIKKALMSGIFPSILKEGFTKPLLKPGKDKEAFVSYRPVTSLKLLENC